MIVKEIDIYNNLDILHGCLNNAVTIALKFRDSELQLSLPEFTNVTTNMNVKIRILKLNYLILMIALNISITGRYYLILIIA